jgi:hypothetical protein
MFGLDTEDDWIEEARRFLYPRIHPYLTKYGGYGIGTTTWDQYVYSALADDQTIEEALWDCGFRRNPVAAYKSLPDGRESQGSWVLWHEEAPHIVEWGKQLHVTLFYAPDGIPGYELYAHYEYDWRRFPRRHLRGDDIEVESAVRITRNLLDGTAVEWRNKENGAITE